MIFFKTSARIYFVLNVLEIEAPYTLQIGQNFFDQPPFSQAFESAKAGLDSHPSHLPQLFNYVWRKYANTGGIALLDRDLSGELAHKIKVGKFPAETYALTTRLRSKKVEHEVIAANVQAFATVGEVLEKYPEWLGYLHANYDVNTYGLEGVYGVGRNMVYYCAETYAFWLSKAAQRTKPTDTTLLGIEEIFPQDLLSSTVSEALGTVGARRENRRWRILQAAEMIRG